MVVHILREGIMKKAILIIAVLALMLGFARYVAAEEKPGAPAAATVQDDRAVKAKEAQEVRAKMAAIEKRAAGQDEELKKIMSQINELNKQREARLNTTLAGDTEYQGLKAKYEALRNELKPGKPKREMKGRGNKGKPADAAK